MNRARMVAAVWDWLPAFRAIAETEHLPTAAKRIGVTPPALSRTLRVLEEAVGVPLFRRTGRRLELAPEGALLLSAVRDAMRLVHDGLDRLGERDTSGPVFLSATGTGKPYMAAAIASMADRYPKLEPRMRSVGMAHVAADLLSGRLDVAVVVAPMQGDDLVCTPLADEPTAIWCGPGHPLHGQEAVTESEVLAHPFVAPPLTPEGNSSDGWPLTPERQVSIRVEDLSVAAQICGCGVALAVLPAVAGTVWPTLWRVPVTLTAPSTLYAVRRRPLTEATDRADLCIALIREAIES